MPTIDIPFNTNGNKPGEIVINHELIQTLPEAFREACEKNKHLSDYVSLIPVEEIGIPEYREKLSRADGEIEKRNILYPVSDDMFVHVCSVPGSDRDTYIPIEPGMLQDTRKLIINAEDRLLDIAGELREAETDEERNEEDSAGCLARDARRHYG